jgi:hypothetical protein
MIQHKMKLGAELAQSLAICDEVWIAVALISDAGFAFIREYIPAGVKQHYLIGIASAFLVWGFTSIDGGRKRAWFHQQGVSPGR